MGPPGLRWVSQQATLGLGAAWPLQSWALGVALHSAGAQNVHAQFSLGGLKTHSVEAELLLRTQLG